MEEMNIKPIKSEKDYQEALARVDVLFEAAAGTPESDELDVLVTLVEAYEKKHFPIPAPDPVEAILYFIESRGLSKAELERILGTPSRVTEVLNYKRRINLRMIRGLHELGMPVEALIKEYPVNDCREYA
jgi:HTH-type transcriptional regulator/antitoxin HigA